MTSLRILWNWRFFIKCILALAATDLGLVEFLVYINRILLPEGWLHCWLALKALTALYIWVLLPEVWLAC
jgi:hypothetical protein